MSGEVAANRLSSRWRSPRALSTITAMIVMAVVVVVVGAAAYVALGGTSPGTTEKRQGCWPPGSSGCAQVSSLHDLSVLAPIKTAYTSSEVPFTVITPTGTTASGYTFNYGDGSTVQTTSLPNAEHSYSSPGTYIVQVTATIGGQTHDNVRSLTVITVAASYAALSAGNAPTVGGQIVSNTSSTSAATAVLRPGQSLTVLGSYLGAPTNPNFLPVAPTIQVSPAASTPTTTSTATTITSSITFANPNTYVVTMIGQATGTGPYAGETAYQNYSWTVVVPQVNGGIAGTAVPPSPHPGTVIYYSTAQGGAQSLDPSIAYDTVSFEPILNVYSGLIMYNGSQTGPDPSNYVPALSTCVPGPNSASCQALYGAGNTLYNATDQSFTFPIMKNAKFYDPYVSGGASWQVYPSDVLFSFARTSGFSDLPSAGSHNGWILAQSILPGPASTQFAANRSWDGGLHYPYNNTPQAVFSSMAVNGSECTAALLANSNGCITLYAHGNNENWPYFLELVTMQLGGSVESCGWVSGSASTAGQAGIPGWTSGTGVQVTGEGDHPCQLPGNVTSTTSSSFASAVAALPAKGWDAWEEAGSGYSNQGGSVGNVISAMVGSGPFYLSGYSIGTSYTLKASQVYSPNPYCTWKNCLPAKGSTPQTVEVTWETDISQGEQAIAAGVADTAGIPLTDVALLLQLIQSGKVNLLSVPTISIYFFCFNLLINLAGAQHYTTNPITVNPDWFTYVGMRQFFSTAYPYTTILKTVLTQGGIASGFNYGGAIPQFMANYYAANVSWPSQDPSAACAGAGANTPACPTYWWNQMTTVGSPYYDPEAAACTTSSPCQLPLIGQTGAPPLDQQENLWVNSLSQYSGGKLKVTYTDINFINLVINSLFSSPGQNPMPVYTLGWAPDFPDPVDYVTPMYYPDSTYTYSDTVAEQLAGRNVSGCSTNFYYYAALTSPVNESCQGAAYDAMVHGLLKAATLAAGPGRVLMYNQAEHIANQLALYVYQYQANQQFAMSAWVNLSSLNTNVVIGGGGDFLWWELSGNGVWG